MKKVEKPKIELNLEEQLALKREQERKEFEEGFKKLCEDKGYRIDPVIELSGSKGVVAGLNIIPTR